MGGAVLKVGELDVGSKFFAPQGEAGSWGFPSDCMARAGGGVYGKSLSRPFLSISVGVVSHWPMCRSYSASFYLFQRKLLHVYIRCIYERRGQN